MAFIPVPNVVACDVIARLFGQIIENTLYFAFPDAPLVSQVGQLAASVGEWAVGGLCTGLSEEYEYLRTEATDISSEGQASITNTVGAGTTGSNTSGCAPGGTCVAVSFRTAFGGRSFRGRNFISGVPLDAIDGNQCTAGFDTGIVAIYESLVPDFIADDLPDAVHVVVSRYHLGAPRVTGIATPILSYLLTNRDIDSQRRRLTGRGN